MGKTGDDFTNRVTTDHNGNVLQVKGNHNFKEQAETFIKIVPVTPEENANRVIWSK